jgi:hypothetical protein
MVWLSFVRDQILRVPFKWRRINKKVGVNFENKFPTPFFKQEKSRRKEFCESQLSVKNGALECYAQQTLRDISLPSA